MNRSRLGGVELLRLVAAFSIVIYHASTATTYNFKISDSTLSLINEIRILSEFVYVFFAISGLVISYRYIENNTSWKTFLTKRFMRIYPLYLLIWLPIAVALISLPEIFRHMEYQNGKFLATFVFGLGIPKLSYIGASWTLWWECIFYLLFAIFMANVNGYKARFKALITINITALVIFSIIGEEKIISSFAIGSVLGCLLWVQKKYKKENYLIVNATIISTAIAFKITPLIAISWIAIKLVDNFDIKIFNATGSIGYPVYLIQSISIPLMARIFSNYQRYWEVEHLLQFIAACLIITLALAYIIGELSEKITKRLKN